MGLAIAVQGAGPRIGPEPNRADLVGNAGQQDALPKKKMYPFGEPTFPGVIA